MNPVAMHEVNKARHQDLEKANDARRRARVAGGERGGLVRTLLEKLGGLVGRGKRPAGATGVGQPDGLDIAFASGEDEMPSARKV